MKWHQMAHRAGKRPLPALGKRVGYSQSPVNAPCFYRCAALQLVAALGLGTGCQEPIDTYDWGERRVLCSTSIDDRNVPDLERVAHAIALAREHEEVVLLYGHVPGGDMRMSTLETVLGYGDSLGLPFVTYRELLPGMARRPGIALGLDDRSIAQWHQLRPLLRAHDARITLFISHFHLLGEGELSLLADLDADGHAIEYHSTNHEDPVAFVDQYGIDEYMDREFWPDLALMRASGYEPQVFAYPHGSRNPQLDRALLAEMPLLRATHNCP